MHGHEGVRHDQQPLPVRQGHVSDVETEVDVSLSLRLHTHVLPQHLASRQDSLVCVQWLASDEGQQVIDRLRDVDPLKARRLFPALSADQISAALTQARHRPAGFPLPLVTSEGIQQATPIPVAQRRAERLAQSVDAVIDAGCGIGLDAWAFQQAGLQVVAFEKDPHTAAVARANGIDVTCADVTQVHLPDLPVYVDPARRRQDRQVSGEAIRTHDPRQWRPPWEWVLTHASLARVAPGLREIPQTAEWHCSSIGRTLVDATVWLPPYDRVDRRASVLHRGTWHELTGPAQPATVLPAQQYIVDPDPAIVRSGLVSNIGGLLDPHLAFVTMAERPAPWLGRAMQVMEEVPLKHVRAACQRLGMHRVTLWARGFSQPPRLGLKQGTDGIVVAARLGPQRVARAWVGVMI